MESKGNIFLNSGVPDQFIRFFRKYQKTKGAWYSEPDGRFAMNFRYYILEGMIKKIQDEDLLVAGALLLSHHELYFHWLLDPKFEKSESRDYELKKIQKTIDELSAYMGKHSNGTSDLCDQPIFAEIRFPLGIKIRLSARLSTANISAIRYRNFFREMPRIWGCDFETAPA